MTYGTCGWTRPDQTISDEKPKHLSSCQAVKLSSCPRLKPPNLVVTLEKAIRRTFPAISCSLPTECPNGLQPPSRALCPCINQGTTFCILYYIQQSSCPAAPLFCTACLRRGIPRCYVWRWAMFSWATQTGLGLGPSASARQRCSWISSCFLHCPKRQFLPLCILHSARFALHALSVLRSSPPAKHPSSYVF